MTNTTNESEELADAVFADIAHGDDEHRAWLKDALRQSVRRVIATALEARGAQLKTVLDREADTIRRYDAKLDERDARIAELEGALRECANDLEVEINGRYRDSAGMIHPALLRRYERDITPVLTARAILTKGNTHD